MELSPAAFAEVKGKLEAAGYEHCFLQQGDEPLAITMHGIALVEGSAEAPPNSLPDIGPDPLAERDKVQAGEEGKMARLTNAHAIQQAGVPD